MDPLDFAPPPAYDDQEFDQKVTRATQISLEAPPTHTQNSEISEERWAEIEEAAFQAAIAASLAESSGSGSAGQSSSHIEPGPPSPSANRAPLSTTRPLRIEKKGKVSVDLKQGKDRPSWLPEADGPSSRYEASGSGLESNPFDGDDIAPPPFADIAPHGSSHFAPESVPQPYQEPVSGQTSATTSPALSDTSLLPNLDALSISASLSGHEWSRPHTPAQRSEHSGGQGLMPNTEHTYNHYRQSLPPSPSQTMGQHYEERRPHSATSPTFAAAAQATMYSRPSPAVPMVNFNPSVAYGKTAMRYAPAPAVVIQQEPQEEVYRANAFYNASVSAHLTPQRKNNQRTTSSFGLIEGKLKDLKGEKEALDDLSMELELADEQEPVLYKIGEIFVHMRLSRALKRLEKDQERLDQNLKDFTSQSDECETSMKELKAKLYAKFGKSINLDE
ncbi:hypothetical protein D9611_002491 [Ephemerocybe angulata]|uniref:Prefoldin subunit 4 n=1 Tax=Ephemerocybe angulata TaxID=980116 RepID=A0A8H5FED2_9AGAR|nr:hypothetical protein D9611_002491 [Tulosesus angulatus]